GPMRPRGDPFGGEMHRALNGRGTLGGLVHLLPLLAVLLWGGVFPGAKIGLREIPVASFLALRIVVAVAVLLLVAGRPDGLVPPRRLLRPLLSAGLARTATAALLVLGLSLTGAGVSAILLATAPLMTALWLALRGRERLSGLQAAGLLAGLLGVALV